MESAARPLAVKRFFKSLSVVLLALAGLAVGAAIFIRLKYPSERVKQILLDTLAQRYGATATCERLAFRLFSGFVLEKIRLVDVKGRPLTIPADFRSPLFIEKITLSYRWQSLLARELEIDEVTITQPFLRYWQGPDSTTNLDAWLKAFASSASAAADTATGLAFSIHLQNFHIENLNVLAMLISAADTQRVAVDRFNAEITQMEIDRLARYRAQFRLFAEPAQMEYQLSPADLTKPARFIGTLPLEMSGALNEDSLSARFEISWHDAQWTLGGEKIALPDFNAHGEMNYGFVDAALRLPALQLKLAEALDLDGSFHMRSQPDTAFEARVHTAHFDLNRITDFLEAHRHFEPFSALQRWQASGTLEIRDSFLRREPSGWQYRAALNGQHIGFADSLSNLKIAGANLQLQWQTSLENPNSSSSDWKNPPTDLLCQLDFASCDLPLDLKSVLSTGPALLRANISLTPVFLPYRGEAEFNWQNFAGGKLRGRANIAAKEKQSPLANLKTFLLVEADSINLAPLTANNMAGRLLHSDLKIEGENLDALHLTAFLRNDSLVYFSEESFGEIPPYDVRLFTLLKTDTTFSRFGFSAGNLQNEIVGATFQGFYEAGKGLLHLEVPEVRLSITEMMPLLPQDLVADSTFPDIAGSAQGRGWLASSISPAGELQYDGNFVIESHDGVYADTLSGVFAEKLEIASEWRLATDSTAGEFRITSPVLRLDYVPVQIPPQYSTGKIIVYSDRFFIREGNLKIPGWAIEGNYEVLGEFLPAGMQVTTEVEGGMQAPDKLILSPTLAVQGNIDMHFILEQYLPDDLTAPQPARLAGGLEIAHLNLEQDSTLAIRDLNARTTFEQEFDLLDLTLRPVSSPKPLTLVNAGEELLLAEILGEANGIEHSSPSRVTLAELQFGKYQFQNIAADLVLGKGRLEATQFRMNLFDGNLIGNILVGLGDGNPDNVTYSISVQASSIDASRLRRLGAHVEKGSKLSADFFLHGSGASPEKVEENLGQLLGALNISKIEPKAASNLLAALDPRGTDVGVQRMRLLLKTGWNVKTMQFEIKNGFVYASLSLIKTKPWTTLFNLPPKLDFARFPLRYFMPTTEE